jgi:hypothetical protein
MLRAMAAARTTKSRGIPANGLTQTASGGVEAADLFC